MARSRAKEERSAGGVVYRMDGGRALYLLIRDSYKNWGFPKGHLEVDEPPELAALREVQEETWLDDLALRGKSTPSTGISLSAAAVHKICHFYLMESPSANTSPQREEASRRGLGRRSRRAAMHLVSNARAVLGARRHDGGVRSARATLNAHGIGTGRPPARGALCSARTNPRMGEAGHRQVMQGGFHSPARSGSSPALFRRNR